MLRRCDGVMMKGVRSERVKGEGRDRGCYFDRDCGRRGADNENDKGAAFCCSEDRASG